MRVALLAEAEAELEAAAGWYDEQRRGWATSYYSRFATHSPSSAKRRSRGHGGRLLLRGSRPYVGSCCRGSPTPSHIRSTRTLSGCLPSCTAVASRCIGSVGLDDRRRARTQQFDQTAGFREQAGAQRRPDRAVRATPRSSGPSCRRSRHRRDPDRAQRSEHGRVVKRRNSEGEQPERT